jgi:hypothetical protein
MMLNILKITLSQAEHRSTVKFSCAAEIVASTGVKGTSRPIVPRVLGLIVLVEKDGRHVPVPVFSWNRLTALEQKYVDPMLRKSPSDNPSAHSASDYDHIRIWHFRTINVQG